MKHRQSTDKMENNGQLVLIDGHNEQGIFGISWLNSEGLHTGSKVMVFMHYVQDLPEEEQLGIILGCIWCQNRLSATMFAEA